MTSSTLKNAVSRGRRPTSIIVEDSPRFGVSRIERVELAVYRAGYTLVGGDPKIIVRSAPRRQGGH